MHKELDELEAIIRRDERERVIWFLAGKMMGEGMPAHSSWRALLWCFLHPVKRGRTWAFAAAIRSIDEVQHAALTPPETNHAD